MVQGEVHPLGEFHERQGVPCLGMLRSGLGKRSVEFREQIGGDLVAFDGFRDAVEEPGLEGFGWVRHVTLHCAELGGLDEGARRRGAA